MLLLLVLLCFGQVQPVLAQKSEKLSQRVNNLLSPVLVKANLSDTMTFRFQRESHLLGHYSRPWETRPQSANGTLTIINSEILLFDSVKFTDRYFYSFSFFNDTTLLRFDYGSGSPDDVSNQERDAFLYILARFHPAFFVKDCIRNVKSATRIVEGSRADTVVYKRLKHDFVKIVINKHNQVQSIEVTYPNELYGDATRIFKYTYESEESEYACSVIEEHHKIVTNKLVIQGPVNTLPRLYPVVRSFIDQKIKAHKPVDIKPNQSNQIQDIEYMPGIHLLPIINSNSRCLLVEFDTFLVLIDAPLNPNNGEELVTFAQKKFPSKKIKYFIFGHHHPHYIGGIRSLIHNETTILTLDENLPYVRQIAEFKHSIKPDALEKNHKPLKAETFTKFKSILEKDMELQIIHIGSISNHTDDYLIFYFPRQKLLFQDDLVWISLNDSSQKASSRQIGLYEAIKNDELEVETILQSWPLADYNVKIEISFDELMESCIRKN